MVENQTNYIIDTNVFLRNPDCIFSFPGSRITVPLAVVEELSNLKTKLTEIGRNARISLKNLEELRTQGSLQEGVPMANGSLLATGSFSDRHSRLPSFLDMSKNSSRMLSACLAIADKSREKAVLVTNDFGLKILAAGFGLSVQGFEDEGVELQNVYESIPEVELQPDDYDFLIKQKGLPKPDYLRVHNGQPYPNMHLLVSDGGGSEKILCRYIGRNKMLRLVDSFEKGIWGIVPRNSEQIASFDLLMDESIDIVVLAGKAGTGKTLLALAAALSQLSQGKTYRKVHVSRPIIPMGRELGYLPGDLDEKLSPWMQPIFDNLEFISNRAGNRGDRMSDYKLLLEKNLIELEALSYIRGRSIPNRFMIVDEAQNLTPHEIKTIITRVGDSTKIVLTGDPYQIDNAYLDSNSNGLTYVIEKLKDHEISGHVYLRTGERSPLAELASNVL